MVAGCRGKVALKQGKVWSSLGVEKQRALGEKSAGQRDGERVRKRHVWSPVAACLKPRTLIRENWGERREGMLGPTWGRLWTYLGFFPKGKGQEREGNVYQAWLVAAEDTKVGVIRGNISPLVSQPFFTSPLSCT